MKTGLSTRNRLRALAAEARYRLSRTGLFLRNTTDARTGLVYPSMVQIQTLNRCNGACVMCPYQRLLAPQPEQRMPEAGFERLVKEIASWGRAGLLVLTFQNEPLLDPRLEAFVRRAKEELGATWGIELTTNGSLLAVERAAALFAAGVDVVNVSMNAATAATYGRLMPGLSFERLEANVTQLLDVAGERLVVLRYLKLRENADEFAAFRKKWQARGAAVIGYDCNDRLGSVENYDGLRAKVSRAHKMARRWLGPLFFRACPFPWKQANVQANGELLMCCHDYGGATSMGNVTGGSLLAQYNSDRYRRVREDLRAWSYGSAPLCARCAFHRDALWL